MISIKMLKKIWYIPVVMLAGVVLLFMYYTQPTLRFVVDVNPSIEVVTNRLERVVKVIPLNDDAEEMLDGYVIKDRSLEKTINDLVDLMIFEGYIHGGQDNLVMISVDDKDADQKTVDKINLSIKAYLENKEIEATLLQTSLDIAEDDLTGKERAIRKMTDFGVTLSEEELSQMTLKELFEYSRAQNIPHEELFHIISGYLYDDNSRETGMLSQEEIRAIALLKVPGEIIKIELDDGEYEVKVLSEGKKYELEIDAYTGAVVEIDSENLEKDDDKDNNRDKDKKPAKKPAKESEKVRLTMDEARKIALAKANGTVIEEKLDDDAYQFEIHLNGKKYEIEVYADTGAITEYEVEDLDDDDDDKDDAKKPEKAKLTMDDARKIALSKANGKIVEEESDDDSYEFEIQLNGKEYSIEINAYTGKVDKFEVDEED